MTEKISYDVVVVGSGIGGLAAAIRAHSLGTSVCIIEKSAHLGGATAWSGGQVWVGANHVAKRLGIEDSIEETLEYVRSIAGNHPELFDNQMATEWVDGAAEAAKWFETEGVIQWRLIPNYEDYYYPEAPGSKATGRYLTGDPIDGELLGESRKLLVDAPHWPIGITYEEMFAWGGVSARDRWDKELMEERKSSDTLTFGQGIAAWFVKGIFERDIDVFTEQPVTKLLEDEAGIKGIRSEGPTGTIEILGQVILATGSHDWSSALSEKFVGIPSEHGGSLAPVSVAGDGITLGAEVGAATSAVPGTAAPITPGYKLPEPIFEGDSGYRGCYEHCMPHTILVNERGRRFCDDSFHPDVIAGAMRIDKNGEKPNLPFFMIWDDWHHNRYGLGITGPGQPYVDGLVTSASDLTTLAEELGINSSGLEETIKEFNIYASKGEDPYFGRGSNASVRTFRGDGDHKPNPNVGPVLDPPFHGMKMRLLNTGIAAGGLVAGKSGRVLDKNNSPIEGLFAVGECVARTTGGGAGYNSGYSLCRAMTYGYLAASEIASKKTG
ncbi:MAG: 3-ketosteroid dehydrogenase [Acidimicrobiaceae bacterium]|nr:3-ketosteroid dehydrogenase [Acidimicrobiaceae bacterium]|tara:strand:- start:376 stop:2031 length:1656 start_codon:yes stop_codon:yes gene_type:complete